MVTFSLENIALMAFVTYQEYMLLVRNTMLTITTFKILDTIIVKVAASKLDEKEFSTVQESATFVSC